MRVYNDLVVTPAEVARMVEAQKAKPATTSLLEMPDGMEVFLNGAKELTAVAATMGIRSATLDVETGEVLVTYRGRTRPASETEAGAP